MPSPFVCCFPTRSARCGPLTLGPGDVVFLREGSAHALADAPDAPLTDFAPERPDPSSPIGRVHVDGPGAQTIMLCGAYQLDRTRPHPLMRELPRLVRLPAHDELGRLVDLLAAELARARPGGDGIVPELAARSGLSRSVFAQRFTTLIGEPPMAYLTWWRMTSAGRLLREPGAYRRLTPSAVA
ncbi:cupin domain-containing protein [Nonomuraea sp. NBC_00507]|uniref:AraC family transcriptional regulator n=1 Tax=Nonomuraea sp. NBC_00507 TaxID=2976002 RepID=UPI002E17AFD2